MPAWGRRAGSRRRLARPTTCTRLCASHPTPPRPTAPADIYTDLGEFEKAALYYDKYISKMDDSVV